MSLDLTVNIATLIFVIGLIWQVATWKAKSESADAAQQKELQTFAREITTEQRAIKEDLNAHTRHEEDQMRDFRSRFHAVNNEITVNKLAHAELAGSTKAIAERVGELSGTVRGLMERVPKA